MPMFIITHRGFEQPFGSLMIDDDIFRDTSLAFVYGTWSDDHTAINCRM